MNHRQRFIATMHYQERDRVPLYDFNFWDETVPEWHKQGLPASVTRGNAHRYFGLDYSLGGGDEDLSTDCNVALCPWFEHRVIEDRGDHELVQQSDGVRVLRKKYMGSIPMHEGHLLVDRKSWREHYKPRLDPAHPNRYPKNWDQCVATWRDPNRDYPIFLPGGSLYGWIRNWMGVENLSLAVYDDPAWFEEMVETIADCIIGVTERILQTGGRFEGVSMWEDMCYNAGPLLSPTDFERVLVPHYRRLTDLWRRYGVDIVWIDCDGCIDKLVPLWLDAGVNTMFPIEVGTWGADPIRFRRQYGRDLRLMGGFDKHILQATPDDITREIKRLAPLVEQGGYIPMPDHRVPPDVPLTNYIHYCREARAIWAGLPPVDTDQPTTTAATA